MTGTRSRIVHRPLPIDDPKQRRPDITLAREKLGWEPRVPLEEGLARTIAYFEDIFTREGLKHRNLTANGLVAVSAA